MTTIKKSEGGIDYLLCVLKEKPRVISRAALWRIPHRTPDVEDINLKIGRYNKSDFNVESVEISEPRSELTLDNEEFRALLTFLHENYEPFRAGVREYVALSGTLSPEDIAAVQALFGSPDRQELIELVSRHELIPRDLLAGLEHARRARAIDEFTAMLSEDRVEHDWQTWFQENDWVLGSEFVRVLDDRRIDVQNIADYLVEAYDGFLDLVEIKRPSGGLEFWAPTKDHGNYVPHSDLTKAITQASNYLFEVEREANSLKFLERTRGVRTIKPRCVLVFGRSANWNDEQHRACRIMNSTMHNLTVLTYDHVEKRARRMLGANKTPEAG